MTQRYTAQRPIQELAVHQGLHETEPPAVDGDDLVWMGRIDADKAPHLAVMAARLLGRRIRIIGPLFDPSYARRHVNLFAEDHVEMVGELGGPAKMAALREARVFVYTAARDYLEAGAAVFGESLRAGTPVAALAWRPGTCAEAALCADTGVLADIDPATDDDQAAKALAEAIDRAAGLPATTVQQIGLSRFNPQRHFAALATHPS
jgi:glycosyltransferase involved in cell wall biosynthesis